MLSDELTVNFVPIFKGTRRLFRDTVIPFLKEKVDLEKIKKEVES